MNLSASGSSTSYGDADIAAIIPPDLSATGASMSTGHATITTLLPVGATTDFAVWPATLPDPAMSLVTAVSAPDGAGRAYLSATIPTQYTTALGALWNAAATAAVTGTFQHVSGNSSSITGMQIEHGPDTNLLPPNAADYRDQLVYTQNSVTTGGVTTYDATVTRVTGHALSGTWCAQLVNNGSLTPYSMGPLATGCATVITGQQYLGTVNIAIARAGASWTGQILWFDSGFNALTSTVSAAQSHPGGGVYQQIRVRGAAPTGAVYAAVIPVITPAAVGDGEVVYVDCHRLVSLQPSGTSAPKPFQPARQQNITLRANRVNYAQNPSLTLNLFGWWSSVGTTVNPGTWDSTVGRNAPGSLKMALTYTTSTAYPRVGTYNSGPGSIAPGVVGQTFTLSVYVLPVNDCPQINILATFGGEDPSGLTVYGDNTSEVTPDAGGWYRLSVSGIIPESVNGLIGVVVYVPQANWDAHAGNVDFWVDDLLVEQSPLLGDYFDASVPSPDYVWEAAAFQSRSHYYDNLRFLQYRLTQLLQDALPAGVSYQLLFAQPNP